MSTRQQAEWSVRRPDARWRWMAGSSVRRRIARGPMDCDAAPASSPSPNRGSARPKRPRRLIPS
eukprot:3398473-Prymnesium_polylepis.1